MEQINKELKEINLKLASQDRGSFQALLLFVVRELLLERKMRMLMLCN